MQCLCYNYSHKRHTFTYKQLNIKTIRIVISTVLLVGGLLSIVQVMPKKPLFGPA